MKVLRLVPAITLTVLGLAATGGAASAATSAHSLNCAGGNIAPGSYTDVVVSGVCYVPAGTVQVEGNLTVAPGALLDGAATPGDPAAPAQPVLPGTLIVGGNVSVGAGAVLAIGCSPMGGCEGVTYDHIGGNLRANGAEGVLLQAVAVDGNVSIVGGGGGVVGGPASAGCFDPTSPIPAPWSEDPALSNPTTGSPQYTDVEDSTIGGNLTITGVQSCFVASFRDRIGGNVAFSNNVTSDPDGDELGSNLIGGNLACSSNLPAVQFGDSGAAPNIVGGSGSGECGLGVLLDNSGSPEHISVRSGSLSTFTGSHVETASLGTANLGTTVSGDTLIVEFTNALLTGALSGPIDSGAVAGPGGEAVAVTAFPDGSQAFEAFDTCSCSFEGASGSVVIEAYGTTTAKGLTRGTFLIRSGGSGNGGLSTLAGFGTFTSAGQPQGTLKLMEHVGLT